MTKYYKLPDSIKSSTLKAYFIEYLTYYCNKSDVTNAYYALSELLELADRQWNTYELLDKDIKIQLEKFLKSIIDFEDEEIMDYILCIIPRLGMGSVFNYILQNKTSIHNQAILENIVECEKEYGQTVDNPYAGM